MIDTIRLKSPYISLDLADLIESESFKRQGINCVTGQVVYEFTTQDLKGSFDSRVMVQVKRKEFKFVGKTPIEVDSLPYIIVEASVNKLLVGHNIYGGVSDFKFNAWYLIKFISEKLKLELPHFTSWKVERLDYALCFKFENPESVGDYMESLNLLSYPRREVYRFGNTGIMIKGTTSVLKFYNKGAEFSKHDRVRLKKFLESKYIFNFQHMANHILRVEIELKSKKLSDLFNRGKGSPFVYQITNDKIYNEYESHVSTFLKLSDKNLELITDIREVNRKLFDTYSSRLAGTLLGFYHQFLILGENYLKTHMKKPTYYRQLKQIKDAGISLSLSEDKNIKKSDISTFTPTHHSTQIVNIQIEHIIALFNEFKHTYTNNSQKLRGTIIS